jgi:nucleoside-diphosphate-sugar epimerase
MAEQKVALVAGANGVVGRRLIEELATRGDWRVIGLGRRASVPIPGVQMLGVDLLDAADVARVLGPHLGVTHLFYAAYQDRPTWAELVPPNVAMLDNVLGAVIGPALRHVSLMQGYKVYGGHLGPFKTPARETDPYFMPPEFMVDQQRLLEARQQGQPWSWSAVRPAVVGGTALGNPLNLVVAIAAYASLSKEAGLPLRFPGKPGAYDKIVEMTDAGLLARATIWAATHPGSANQAYNINNGDVFRWSEMWPLIARYFDMDVAPPLPLQLTSVMADKEAAWQAMQARHGLAPIPYKDVSSWPFADFVWSWDYDMFADGSKARRHGFVEHVQTSAMLFDQFDQLRAAGVIPGS